MRKYQNHSPNRLRVKSLYNRKEGMKVALIGDVRYENRGEIKDLIFKLKQKNWQQSNQQRQSNLQRCQTIM